MQDIEPSEVPSDAKRVTISYTPHSITVRGPGTAFFTGPYDQAIYLLELTDDMRATVLQRCKERMDIIMRARELLSVATEEERAELAKRFDELK